MDGFCDGRMRRWVVPHVAWWQRRYLIASIVLSLFRIGGDRSHLHCRAKLFVRQKNSPFRCQHGAAEAPLLAPHHLPGSPSTLISMSILSTASSSCSASPTNTSAAAAAVGPWRQPHLLQVWEALRTLNGWHVFLASSSGMCAGCLQVAGD